MPFILSKQTMLRTLWFQFSEPDSDVIVDNPWAAVCWAQQTCTSRKCHPMWCRIMISIKYSNILPPRKLILLLFPSLLWDNEGNNNLAKINAKIIKRLLWCFIVAQSALAYWLRPNKIIYDLFSKSSFLIHLFSMEIFYTSWLITDFYW